MSTEGHILRPATLKDVPKLVETFIDCFLTYPHGAYVYRLMDPKEAESRQRRIAEYLITFGIKNGLRTMTIDNDCKAMALWWFSGPSYPSRFNKNAYMELKGDVAGSIWIDLRSKLKDHEPQNIDHVHLSILGVRSDFRGQKLGKLLLEDGLNFIDHQLGGFMVHLHTSYPENVEIYKKFGFYVKSVLEIPDGPTYWNMIRDPRQPTALTTPDH